MTGQNKLRLVMTLACPRQCAGCCNKQWDWSQVPTFDGDYSKFDMVMFTGGEPMLIQDRIMEEVLKARKQNPDIRLVLYTAKLDDPVAIRDMMDVMDGLTVTLHDPQDVPLFRELDAYLSKNLKYILEKYLRCNVFKEAGKIESSSLWHLKTDMEWIPDCPLPVGETLMKHEKFYSE